MEAQNKIFKKTIAGTEYTAQFYGLRTAMKAHKACRDDINPRLQDSEKLADYVLTNVIVDPPGLSIESFDDFDILNEVVSFGTSVLNNKFRPEEETGTKGRSRK